MAISGSTRMRSAAFWPRPASLSNSARTCLVPGKIAVCFRREPARGGRQCRSGDIVYERPQQELRDAIRVSGHTSWHICNPTPFNAFVNAYNDEGKIQADWIILGSEALSDKNPAREFFRRFLNDPNVRWIARFREGNGEEIYIGEVSKGTGVPADKAPLMDVKTLSDRYEAKYDRLSFLKHNMEHESLSDRYEAKYDRMSFLKNNVEYTWHY